MIRFADRMNLLTGSEIRELLKLTAQPDIISFAGGLPAPELFPVEGMKAAAIKTLEESGEAAMQYSTTEGFPPLRQKIVDRMKAKNGIQTDIDHILITSGSQQGLDFAGRVFLNPGDVVLMESPSYLGAINAFKASEPKFVEVPTDNNGMLMEELEKILATTDNVKMIYVIPDFQNPSGRTWTLERREKFMEIINKFEIPVIEDNPYGELRFENENMPSLKSMDTKDLVIFLGTFSKILAPGYRLGWVCAEDEILEKFNFIKQGADLQSSTVSQIETNTFLEMNDLDQHVAKIKEVYGKRRNCMLKAMEEYFPKECTWTYPDGGLFTWVILPEYMDAKELATQCLEKKVAYVPGGSFFPNGGHENTFRMNYSNMPEEKIEEGIKRIAEVIKANLR
ncbi:2-aminoadipate transaminase [Anaerotignum neopropionicum]|uniref:2-aminoadipate transaminase n=1 Tax=Anaerotignum neopropionicum TaxID=36847 RepID=A0A136WI92_9FIRM|nr:PLP-dependent aminotransferase family protein [Anaerotignum neopropionicum]KXL54265.1 2-aminoadipate transaminase [Anaerotignum neopropionicum]KXL54390.1 2-aminoadipate transaminase [Anaerotignum neopropionicum]